MRYVYPAEVYAEEKGGYSVIFPDVEGAVTQGEDLYEMLVMAEDALGEILVAYENVADGRAEKMSNRIVEPSDIRDFVQTREKFYTLIKVDTDEFRKNHSATDSLHELYYSPNTQKYFTVLKNDDVNVKSVAEKTMRELAL